MLETLKPYLAGIKLGDSESVGDKLRPILTNKPCLVWTCMKLAWEKN